MTQYICECCGNIEYSSATNSKDPCQRCGGELLITKNTKIKGETK